METPAARNRAQLDGIYARYARGDASAIFDALAEDVVWETEGSALPWGGRFEGLAGVQAYFERLGGLCEICGYELERLMADDEWVIALATVQICIRATGRREAFRKVDAIRLRDGQIVEFREYYDSARAAAALAE